METNRRQSTVMDHVGARADIDAGLRSYMLRVYNYMALGVAFTGAVVLFMSANPNLMVTLAVGPVKWVLFFAVLGMGWFSNRIMTMQSTAAAHAFYWVYAGLWGVMISPMVAYFLQTTAGTMDVARAFFITAGMFAGTSIFGYTTKKDLSGLGRFFVMASIGLLIAMVINIFVASTAFSLVTSFGAVLLFAGITAWETQAIKNMYYSAGSSNVVTRMAIFGAFTLYGSFVVMFIHILNILGIMRNN
ncbi:Bax inhibitor-1/YccA family protein [Aestuariispira ectoiniformans]|uniref:Bax inhibitor-1/YccA family protein n=1 Tax=Aestuariispira ectoiniformans TaxID=2775080 RepID=UPI00223BB549|nr:Bax inhibitor-1/YccA family protein [Aestuariispira ectoiniformans]